MAPRIFFLTENRKPKATQAPLQVAITKIRGGCHGREGAQVRVAAARDDADDPPGWQHRPLFFSSSSSSSCPTSPVLFPGPSFEAVEDGGEGEGARGLEDEAEVIEGDLHGSRHALVAVNGHGTRQTRALRSFRARGNMWTAG